MPNVPYEPQPMGGLAVAGGASGVWALDVPSRCVIHRLIVEQVGGTAVGFTVELFSTDDAARGQGESESAGTEHGLLTPGMYKVGKTFTGSAGLLTYNAEDAGGFGYPFFSQERPAREIGNRRKLYIKITPDGSGQKVFCAALGVLVLE